MNKTQKKIFDEISKEILIFENYIDYSFGFGSFWQDFKNYNDDSDIDFLIILKTEPEYSMLNKFFNNLKNINKKYSCKCSAQIFVGKYENLFSELDNILRLLTIYNKNEKVIEIFNKNNYNLYQDIKKIEIDILNVFRLQLCRIIRFYNRDFYKFQHKIDMYRYNEIKQLFISVISYYKLNSNNKDAKYLRDSIIMYYDNYEKYMDYELFHKMLIDLCELINNERRVIGNERCKILN